jgi:hypothetical protein
MSKHQKPRFFLCHSKGFSLVQLVIASPLLKEPIQRCAQRVSLLLGGTVPIVQELAIQLPEVVLEGLQEVAMDREAGHQLLVMAKFVDPAQRQLHSQPVKLRGIVTD